MATADIQIKRAYTPASGKDGWRILVDRLWPRGIDKKEAALNDWCKDVAPSGELRKWFNHEPAKWPEFRKKYRQELKENQEALAPLIDAVHKHALVTLVYAAKDDEHNNAVVLKELLLSTVKK